MPRLKLGTIIAAIAIFAAGLIGPPATAHASPAPAAATANVGVQTTWWVYAVYPDRQSCADVGAVLISPPWYLYIAYNCTRRPDGSYNLWVLDYY